MCEEWRTYYNTQRPCKALKYLTPLTYADQHYRSLHYEQPLYPQTAIENDLQIEESLLVDKVIEKPNDQQSKTPVSD